jgi:hypothetical protein
MRHRILEVLGYVLLGIGLVFLVTVTKADSQITAITSEGIQGEPVLYFGVTTCGKKVLWVLMANGHFFRFDDDHHPDDMPAFLKQLRGLPGDVKDVPCPVGI